jgi:hypothetical protein
VCDVIVGGGFGDDGGFDDDDDDDGDDCVQLTLSLNDNRSTRSMKDSLALSDV